MLFWSWGRGRGALGWGVPYLFPVKEATLLTDTLRPVDVRKVLVAM